jgi:hypothetical protein
MNMPATRCRGWTSGGSGEEGGGGKKIREGKKKHI